MCHAWHCRLHSERVLLVAVSALTTIVSFLEPCNPKMLCTHNTAPLREHLWAVHSCFYYFFKLG